MQPQNVSSDQSFLDAFIKTINTPLFTIGETGVTLGGVSFSVFIFFIVMIVSAILQKVASRHLSQNAKLAPAVIYSISRIIHYIFIVVGVVLAAQCIGINFGTLAVAFGFLGVGIGFGLQNVTSNFISGVILLLERPIGIGDYVSFNGTIAEVKSISMRSTKIRTFDNITIIVPNAKLVENDVINWTVEDPSVRIHCPVGVAYGSDVQKVKSVLLGVAKKNENVLGDPKPEVRFLEFGDSSLNFDLLVWTDNPQQQKILRSDINYSIDQAFRDNEIRIPFPQRDLHLQMTPAVKKLASR